MVDIHCHILPEVDDGAWNQETAMEMARMAVHSGTNRIIATPHFQGVSASPEQVPYPFRAPDIGACPDGAASDFG